MHETKLPSRSSHASLKQGATGGGGLGKFRGRLGNALA